MSPDLGAELRDTLGAAGACLVGYADLSVLPEAEREGYPVGVSLAAALRPQIVARLANGPGGEYLAEYQRLNALLAELGQRAAAWLEERGYRARAMAPVVERERFDIPALTSRLPHKTVATRAGLGWIGKCALLVTEAYGPAVRITSVLTDAPLPVGAPIVVSRCGECIACQEVCPGEAVSGRLWQVGMAREEFFDAAACRQACRAQCEPQGIEETICGRCIAACPWTPRFPEGQRGFSAGDAIRQGLFRVGEQ